MSFKIINIEKSNSKNMILIKTTFLILCLFIVNAISVNASTLDGNLISNPGFENGIIKPFNWTFEHDSGNGLKWDIISHSGARSIKINISGITDGISGYPQSDLILVKPSQSYILTAWGKTSNSNGTNAPAVRVVELDASKKWIKQNNIIFGKGTNDWMQKKISFITSANTTYLYVYANIWKGYGEFWIDDINLAFAHSPYGGIEWLIPGIIQAENFDNGGEGIAYHDLDTSNNGGQYRTSDAVDIEKTTDTGTGYNIGWMIPGEWLEYSANVQNSGMYDLEIRVASNGIGGKFHIESNDVDKTGLLTIPNTGGLQTWWTISKPVFLDSGSNIIKIVIDEGGATGHAGNINFMKLTQGTIPTLVPTLVPTPVPTPVPTLVPTPVPAPVNSFYVAKNGKDSNPGTESQPWLTIQKAADIAQAGDMVFVRTGTYYEKVTIQNSGTAGNFIVFAAYPGETPIIDGSNIPDKWDGMIVSDQNYIKISGFRLQNNMAGSYNFGIKVGGHHIIIQNNTLYKIGGSGIFVSGAEFTDYYKAGDEDVIIENNVLSEINCKLNGGVIGMMEGIDLHNSKNFVIRNNLLYSMCKESISVGPAEHGRIYGNRLFYGYPINKGTFKENWPGIYVSGDDIHIYNNFVVGDEIGIAMATDGSFDNTNVGIYNNILINNEIGIRIGVLEGDFGITTKNISLIGNTIVDSKTLGIMVDNDIGNVVNGIAIRNNILSNNPGPHIYSKGTITNLVIDHNLFNAPATITGMYAVTGDPFFVNPSVPNLLPGGVDPSGFNIKSGSYAIDKGSVESAPSFDFIGNTRLQGSGYDIGAFES